MVFRSINLWTIPNFNKNWKYPKFLKIRMENGFVLDYKESKYLFFFHNIILKSKPINGLRMGISFTLKTQFKYHSILSQVLLSNAENVEQWKNLVVHQNKDFIWYKTINRSTLLIKCIKSMLLTSSIESMIREQEKRWKIIEVLQLQISRNWWKSHSFDALYFYEYAIIFLLKPYKCPSPFTCDSLDRKHPQLLFFLDKKSCYCPQTYSY